MGAMRQGGVGARFGRDAAGTPLACLALRFDAHAYSHTPAVRHPEPCEGSTTGMWRTLTTWILSTFAKATADGRTAQDDGSGDFEKGRKWAQLRTR